MNLLADLRYGLRTFAQRPLFTALAVLTIGLGVGATTTIFSVVDAVLLRPQPYPDADRLLVLWEANQERGYEFMNVAPPNFADWQARARSFETIGVWRPLTFTLGLQDAAEQLHGANLSHEMFDVLRVPPLHGRPFTADDDRPGAAPVAIISRGLWQRAFGGDPATVGRRIPIDGVEREVIGIMPGSFNFPPPVALEGVPAPANNDVWIPFALDYAGGQRGAHYLLALGRLKAGVTTAAAGQELVGIADQLAREQPATNAGWTARVVPLDRQVTGDQRPALLVLSIAVGLVLALACANVAGLLLARGLARRREIAIRVSLGATRRRIVRQLLTEGALLAAAGGVAGVILAAWLTRGVRGLGGPMLPRLEETAIDGRALAFTAFACMASCLLFGLAPALQALRGSEAPALKERPGGQRTGLLQSALVAFEIALTVVLLAGAVLLGRSFTELLGTDPGFRTERTLTAHFTLRGPRYGPRAARVAFMERLLERLRAAPEVLSAGVVDTLPLADDRQGTSYTIDGETPEAGVEYSGINFCFVMPGYFEALGVPVLQGRVFTAADRDGSAPVIVVNQTLARRLFGDANPIGRRVRAGFSAQTPREIVGVVADERHVSLDSSAPAGTYLPWAQVGFSSRLTVVVRTAGRAEAAAPLVREAVRALDPAIPLHDVRTMEQVVGASVSRPRFALLLFAMFGGASLVLAGIGLYGMVTQVVGQRTAEFGIRLALGAAPADLGRLVVTLALRLAMAGFLVGLPLALGFSRVLGRLLFTVSPYDPLTYGGVVALLGGVAVLAALVPAVRAMRVNPIVALRVE
jgi:predicted permease